MHLEAVIERDTTSTLRRSMDGEPGAETLFIRQLTRPLSSHGGLANGGQSCREAGQMLKLHSGVNL